MATRFKDIRSPTAVNLSGTLAEAIDMHAKQRVIHFFNFIFMLDALCRRVQAVNGAVAINPADVVSGRATHQIDSGDRSNSPSLTGFDNTDPNIIFVQATAFTRLDAAHFCNLGVEPRFWALLLGVANTDPCALALAQGVVRLAGDTRLLPQRVNIGPDRVIDVLHGILAERFLRGRLPVLTAANLTAYFDEAKAALTVYRDTKRLAGDHGVAACCDAYIAAYTAHCDSIAATLYGNICGDCAASGGLLNQADYIA